MNKKREVSPRIAILASEFHQDIINVMIHTAEAEIKKLGATVATTIRVPGSYEMPLVANQLLSKKTVDGLVVLGYIEKGETLHGEIMGHVVHKAFIDLQLKYKKPMGIGIIGPGATKDQALKRKEAYAQGAVQAVLKSLQVLKKLSV